MPFQNKQGVTSITMKPKFHAYCPLGQAYYSGVVTINVTDPSQIPDYCDIDKLVHEFDGDNVIIEDVVKSVFDAMCEEVESGYVVVSCEVNDAAHSPVVVTKEGEAK